MKWTKTFIMLMGIGMLFCSGCFQTINWYPPGPERSPFDVATIQILEEIQMVNLELEIDGQPLEWKRKGGGMGVSVRILPGKHNIKWKYTAYNNASGDAIMWGKGNQSVTNTLVFEEDGILDAKKGKLYNFHFAHQRGRKTLDSSQSSSSGSVYFVEVRDKATWLSEIGWSETVVVGKKPLWTDFHTCELCGNEKASPYEYGCFKCR